MNQKLELKYISISKLSPFEGNPRKISDKGLEILDKSVKHYGITNPILAWQNPKKPGKYEILAGHQRLKVFEKQGIKEIPVILLDIKDWHDAYSYLLMDNKSQDYSEWDFPMLKDLTVELDDGLIEDIEITGFEEGELEDIFGYEEEEVEAPEPEIDRAEELQKKWGTELGQIWRIGDHRLMCGDATVEKDVKRLMDGKKADMCFCDPPYLMGFSGNIHKDGSKSFNAKYGDIENDELDEAESGIFLSKMVLMIKEFVMGSYYLCFYRLGIEKIINALLLNGLNYKSVIIWHKNNHNLSNSDYNSIYEPIVYGWNQEHKFYGTKGSVDFITAKRGVGRNPSITTQGKSIYLKSGTKFYKFERVKKKPKNYIEIRTGESAIFNMFYGENDIWEIDKMKKNDLHPTMKPIELCSRAINNSSKIGDIILDLFGGSGSTMVAAHQLERCCYMMEIDPQYIAVILQRVYGCWKAKNKNRLGSI